MSGKLISIHQIVRHINLLQENLKTLHYYPDTEVLHLKENENLQI